MPPRLALPAALHSYPAVLAAAALLRLAAFALPSLPDLLQRRPEISTPLVSFRSLKEGVFLYSHGTNPYIGGTFYHSPIYLGMFTHVVPIASPLATAALWTLVDLWGSGRLLRIAGARRGSSASRNALVAALYLFNPYTLATCLARSTASVDTAILLTAISAAIDGNISVGLFLLTITSAACVYPVLLFPPIIMLLWKHNTVSGTRLAIQSVATVATSASAVSILGYFMVGWNWVPHTLGLVVSVADLTPNVGMWWYFFTEMFDHFRTFFLGVFQLHTVIYVAPICLRLSDDPLFALLLLVGIISTWKSYPSLGDMALWAGLLGCFPDIVSNLRHPLFTFTVHLYTAILLPLLHSLWLLTGTGNANFFYAATMVYGLNASLAIVDVLGAGLRHRVKTSVDKWATEQQSIDGGAADTKIDWDSRGWHAVQFSA
ncbi:hypothetical protein L202_02299 [Cryptococcus amylolentus CBS 6039]|uniref:PIG-U-domain-containing protein n=2 Tax=Cryptococcus amylolentus CBS 6039 TaxID=1295533 RepID=A0A1E3I017_9TREE|nr:hypothetical protein L202_02299 [Cryptococcus amylolentus CBS 6039]ODN81964.1 hypothetical protein L202_02299 [Cryptococcus amylolentus CBS 6039]